MLEMAREEIPEEKKLELIFAKEQTAIKANDLQGFIFYFNMYYLKLIEDYSIRDLNQFINNEYDIKKSFNFTNDDYYYYSKKLYTNNDLLIFEIEKHSPLKIIFGGSMIALILAVILSGGTLEIDASKFKIKTTINKSLGESLQDLRRVLKEDD
jgi:hypothetical protein